MDTKVGDTSVCENTSLMREGAVREESLSSMVWIWTRCFQISSTLLERIEAAQSSKGFYSEAK